MPFWNRTPDADGAESHPFRWTEEAVSQFMASFSAQDGTRRLDVSSYLTHQKVERRSSDLSTSMFLGGDSRDRYFGWVQSPAALGARNVRLVPLQVVLAHRPDRQYRETNLEDFSAAEALGTGYLWQRGGKSSARPHGIEVTLALDSKRYAAFKDAISAHKGNAPPRFTLALRQDPELTSVKRDENAVSAGAQFDVVAFWSDSWTLWYGDAENHPWAAELME